MDNIDNTRESEDTHEEMSDPRIEEYLRLDELEKDIAIQQAVIRLQNRLCQIFSMMDTELKCNVEKTRKAE